jgi:hypothetical protein
LISDSNGKLLIHPIENRIEAISKKGFWFNPPEADKDRGGAAFSTQSLIPRLIVSSLWVKTGGILEYFEDLRPTNKIKLDGSSRNAGDAPLKIKIDAESGFAWDTRHQSRQKKAGGQKTFLR